MKKSKKLLLGAISAMSLVAVGTGAVSTLAWFQATNNATVSASNVAGTIGATVSELNLGNAFTVQVSVIPTFVDTADTQDSKHNGSYDVGEETPVELTHLGEDGKLYRGGYYAAGDARTVEVTTDNIGNCVKSFTVLAAWNGDAPSAAADLAYLNGKKASVTLTASGYARLASNATYSSGSEADENSATVVLYFDLNDGQNGINITVNSYTNNYYRVEPRYTDGSGQDQDSDHTNDKINVTTGALELTAQSA